MEIDYRDVLKRIYKPEFGSIWKAPNKIWTNNFAKNKSKEDLHPAIVERVRNDNVSVQLVPGTTKEYKKGSCVFKVDLAGDNTFSYFLLKLSMPYIIEDLLNMERGWNGVDVLNEDQIHDFKWQIKMCKG
ncbi:MAG TPA: hypothetical protein PLG05_04410 [Bacteroidales bacterium]|nr:hypothetical protein [Bacteroidales bacterium]HOR59951.1 hypothetical protein [Bacteroidales bacterium]HPL04397.1 hypothetical protein [Bacteroidales bacterium]